MTWTLVQSATSTGSLNVSFSSNVSSGNLVVGIFTNDIGHSAAISYNDDQNNTYALLDRLSDTGFQAPRGDTIALVNITNGPKSVTANGASLGLKSGWIIEEWTNSGGASAGIDGHTGQIQSSNTSATDNITSTSITTTVDGDLIWGVSLNESGSDFPSAGTGFTANTQVTQFGTMQTESATQSTHGSIAATFTNATSEARINFVVAFKPAAATAPLSQQILLLPAGPPRQDVTWTWSQIRMLGQDQLPVRQLDWPVPRGYEPDWRRSWEWKYNPNLISQDQLPVRQLDWQNPIPQFRIDQTWTQSLLQTTLAPNFARPQNQYDWPVPRAAEPDWRRSWERSLNLNLVGQDQLPIRQQDWQLPIIPPRPDETWIQGFSNFRPATVLVMPRNQYDWPVPRGYEPDWRRSWEWSYNRNLIRLDQLPVRQQDWPVPIQQQGLFQIWEASFFGPHPLIVTFSGTGGLSVSATLIKHICVLPGSGQLSNPSVSAGGIAANPSGGGRGVVTNPSGVGPGAKVC